MTKKQVVEFIMEDTTEWERSSSVTGGLIGLIQIKNEESASLLFSLEMQLGET